MKTWITEKLISNGKLVSKRCNVSWFEKNGYLKQYQEIIKQTGFLKEFDSFPQRIWHIVNNHLYPYKCNNPTCNKTPTFFAFTRGYLRTCSQSCAQLDPQTINKIEITNISRYGVSRPLSLDIIREKSKKTWTKKYGVDNPTKSTKIINLIKQNNLKKHGVEPVIVLGVLVG